MAGSIILSLFLGGIHTGCLIFVSFVSARLLYHLSTNNQIPTLRVLFPLWWPYGRDLMAPLNVITALAYLSAYYQRGGLEFIGGMLAMVFIVGWTVAMMGEDIEKLRAMKDKDVGNTAKAFCKKHHVRTLVAVASYLWILSGTRKI